jgi:hypothetical protein
MLGLPSEQPRKLVQRSKGGIHRQRALADTQVMLRGSSTARDRLPAVNDDQPPELSPVRPRNDHARNENRFAQLGIGSEPDVLGQHDTTEPSARRRPHSLVPFARAPTSARNQHKRGTVRRALLKLPAAFYPRSVPVIDLSCGSHTWTPSVRHRTKPLPCVPGSRRKLRGRHANCPPLHSAGFLIPIASSQQETKDRSIGRTKGEDLTAARRPNPQALPLPGRPAVRGGLSIFDPASVALAAPNQFRGETVGAVRALRRLGTSFSLGNAQPGAPRDHSAEPSSVSIKGRSDAHRRAIAVSPIAVHSNSSLSFTAKTDQPPSTSRRAASKTIKIISFNRPQDARRRFLNVEKAGVERRG